MEVDGISVDERNLLKADSLNVVVEARCGTLCLNRFSPIGRSILFYGEHAWNELSFCKTFIDDGDVVFDIGAHQGTHSIAFAQWAGPSGIVHAFEPQRLMYQNICASVALNSLVNVHAVNVAVGATRGIVRIVDFDYSKRGHFSGMRVSPENTGAEVRQISVDDYVSNSSIGKISFMKIDVEGYELNVILGASESINRFRPIIYCEYHESFSQGIKQRLSDFGYILYRHDPRGFNPNNFFGYPEDRFRGGVDHNVICIPKERKEEFDALLTGLKPVV